MKRTRLSVIGLGMASAPHARSLADLADRVEVAAVYSPSAERRSAFATEHGVPAVDSLEAVLGDPAIDAVMLLTPPNSHLELVRQAAAAGKHILLEKPLETSLSRAAALVETAEAAGVTLAVVLQHRFRPVGEALVEAVRGGRLGTLVAASARGGGRQGQEKFLASFGGVMVRCCHEKEPDQKPFIRDRSLRSRTGHG